MTYSSERREVARIARDLLQQNPLFLDTETTGMGPDAEIIEIALVDKDGLLVFESLVRPKGVIDPDALRVHGINFQMLQGAPSWREVWPQVEPLLSSRMIGVYNLEFDLRLMRQSNQKYWLEWHLDEGNFFCIMRLYARFYGEWDDRRGSYRWYSLEQAGKQSGILLPNSHRAREDALLARALMVYMADFC